MAQNDDYILDILTDNYLITSTQATEARSHATPRKSAIEWLVESGMAAQEDISRAVATSAAMEFVDLSEISVPPQVVLLLPADAARRYRAVPLAGDEHAMRVAVADPLNFDALDSLNYLLKREVEFVCATPEQIQDAIRKYYGTMEDAITALEGQLGEGIEIGDMGGGEEGGEVGDAPIIKMVSMLLLEAYKMRASDIHLEPLEKRFRVRFRIDGVLHEIQNPPKKLQSAIVSRLKIMTGSMSIAEKRLPQDGRIQVKVGKKSLDLRVSTLPTNHGESVVMRILDKSALVSLGLPELGFFSDDQEIFEKLIALPDGIILVTGPTGSGKTTTLYACLNYINRPDRKIITVEDPVEYQMSGVNQVQVNADIGMTFPSALRAMLRQAPNIIMIGEIRDAETANIAINASLTGHLVLSTLHTNDAPGAVARLVDIGVQPFLVSSSVRAIVAQRLVRKLCPKCKQHHDVTDAELRALRIDGSQIGEATIMGAHGCDACRSIGYKGRMGIFEVFVVDDEVRFQINERATTLQLRKRARELGMRTLREDGVRKVLAGLTTPEEVISVTMGDAD